MTENISQARKVNVNKPSDGSQKTSVWSATGNGPKVACSPPLPKRAKKRSARPCRARRFHATETDASLQEGGLQVCLAPPSQRSRNLDRRRRNEKASVLTPLLFHRHNFVSCEQSNCHRPLMLSQYEEEGGYRDTPLLYILLFYQDNLGQV